MVDVAENHHNRILLMQAFMGWLEQAKARQRQKVLADRLFHRHLARKVLKRWHRFVVADRRRLAALSRRADALYRRNLQKSALRAWYDFVPIAQLDRQRQQRANVLRAKVATWLPDYVPPELRAAAIA